MDEQPVRKKGPTNTLGDGGEGCDMDVLLKQLLGTVLRRCRVRSVNRRSFFLAEPMAALAVVSSLASAYSFAKQSLAVALRKLESEALLQHCCQSALCAVSYAPRRNRPPRAALRVLEAGLDGGLLSVHLQPCLVEGSDGGVLGSPEPRQLEHCLVRAWSRSSGSMIECSRLLLPP